MGRWAPGPGGSAGRGIQRAGRAGGAGAGGPRGARLAGAGGGRGQAGAQAWGGIGLSGHWLDHCGRGALQALAAHVVVLLPVLVLAEGAAVAGRVAAAARLAGLAPAVPAALGVRGHGQRWPGPAPQFPRVTILAADQGSTHSKHTCSDPAATSPNKKRKTPACDDPLQTRPLSWAILGGRAPTTPAHPRQVHGGPQPLPSLPGSPPGLARAPIPERGSPGGVKRWAAQPQLPRSRPSPTTGPLVPFSVTSDDPSCPHEQKGGRDSSERPEAAAQAVGRGSQTALGERPKRPFSPHSLLLATLCRQDPRPTLAAPQIPAGSLPQGLLGRTVPLAGFPDTHRLPYARPRPEAPQAVLLCP